MTFVSRSLEQKNDLGHDETKFAPCSLAPCTCLTFTPLLHKLDFHFHINLCTLLLFHSSRSNPQALGPIRESRLMHVHNHDQGFWSKYCARSLAPEHSQPILIQRTHRDKGLPIVGHRSTGSQNSHSKLGPRLNACALVLRHKAPHSLRIYKAEALVRGQIL